MVKKILASLLGLWLLSVPSSALSQLSPPFQPFQPGPAQHTATTAQRYLSHQHGCSFIYPQGWTVSEEEGTVMIEEPQRLAWVTMWSITELVDPQTYLQEFGGFLQAQFPDYTVASRKEVMVNGVTAIREDASYTLNSGTAEVSIHLLFYQNNQPKLMAVTGVGEAHHSTFSPALEQVLASVILTEIATSPSEPTRTVPQTQQPAQVPEVKAWLQYRMHQFLGLTHDMAATYVEHPHDWQIVPDYAKGMVTFTQDEGQTVAFTLCPWLTLQNPAQRTASEFFEILLAEGRKTVPDLEVVAQEFPDFQNFAGVLASEGRAELQGTENGILKRYYVWVSYMYTQGFYSSGLAMFGIGEAPVAEGPNMKRYVFDRMVRSFLNSFPKAGGTGKGENGKPGNGNGNGDQPN